MISTLHKYIGRDLLKISLLASSVFTLVMTTYSVLEPLRKQGLAGGQVFMLFWYLVPVMLSLTLPIAVLFAATYVYGRFSMDNELTASRAGGISLWALMTPALLAGVLVGLTTLLLSNHIAPELARRGEITVRKNLKGIIYQQLKSESSVYLGKNEWLLHADGADRKNDQLRGLVVLNMSDKNNLSYYTASLARVQFDETDEGAEISVVALNPTSGDSNDNRIFELGHFIFGPRKLETAAFRDKASFYKWGDLFAILKNPRRSLKVGRMLESIYEQLGAVYFATDMAEAVKQSGSYELYHSDGYRYVFSAPAGVIGKKARLTLWDPQELDEPDALPVKLDIYSAKSGAVMPVRRMECHHAVFNVVDIQGQPKVSAVLEDVAMLPIDVDGDIIRKKSYPVGLLEMPGSVDRELAGVTLEELYQRPDLFPLVSKKTSELKEYIRDKLRPKILAEINGRLAYGIGCIMLIPVGAALGLRYKGGHILSAFALACVPAILLLVLMLMGQQMMTNPDSNQAVGLTAIWLGVVLLAILKTWLFAVALRK